MPTLQQGTGYWIHPDGRMQKLTFKRHIELMIADPEAFGTDRASIAQLYRHFDEPMGFEGRARAELIKAALANGFIHIRLQVNHFLAINVWQTDADVHARLKVWAKEAESDPQGGSDMPVRLVEFGSRHTTHTTLAALVANSPEVDNLQ